jgi:hypothetical protein
MLMCVFLSTFAHETSGAARTRSSLRPLFFEGETIYKTRAHCVAGTTVFVMPAQAGIQYSEALAMETRIRGVLDTRLRGYDGGGWIGWVA